MPKLSQLAPANPVGPDDSFPVVQGGVTRNAKIQQVLDAFSVASLINYTPLGSWNALTNTPALSNGGGGGTQGDSYFVGVAGTPTIDGVSTWDVGDLILNNGVHWVRVPWSTTLGTMSGQNASDVAITGGSATVSTVGITNGGTIAGGTGTDDAYFLDADGGVLAKYSNSIGAWVFPAPVSASTGSFATLNAGLLSPTQISLTLGSSPESSIYTNTTGDGTQPLLLWLDVDGGVINKVDPNTGELAHQAASGVTLKVGASLDSTISAATTNDSTQFPLMLVDADGGVMNKLDPATGGWVRGGGGSVNVPAALVNAGRYRTRLTAKPVFSEQATVSSAANTTYAAILTTESQGSLFRFIVPSASSGPATIKMAFAFPDVVGDGINPTVGGNAIPWTTVTWTNAGADVDYTSQLAALNIANMTAPTSFALPQADAVNYGSGSPNPGQIFHWYLTDWMPGTSVLRADGGSGACLIFVRLYVTTGTLALAANSGDVSGAYDSFLFGRTLRSYKQAVDGVTTPSNFTSTTRVGQFAVHGVQYESLNRGICIMIGGDSTTAGTGSDFGIWGAWRRVAMALSTPTTPVELANFAQPAADFYTYSAQMGLAVDLVKPTVAYLQAWSRNSWKNIAEGGWNNTLQIGIGGTITAGNTVSTTITDTNVTGSPVTVTYTVLGGDTKASVAAGLAAAFTATTALFTAGYRAASNGVWTNIRFPSTPPTAGTATVSGGATLTATGYFGYFYVTQQIADMALAASLTIADRVESYGGVYVGATLYGDIGMTPQTDATRQATNAAIRAMSNRVVVDYDAVLSGSTGPAGAPMIPSSLSADNVHPNDAGHAIEAGLLQPAVKTIYGLS